MFIARRFCIQSFKNSRKYSDYVKVVEVGPRDGLQNEKKILSTSVKVDLINRLSDTGLQTIEVTSFVSSKWIPQMADGPEVFKQIIKRKDVNYPVLIPNVKGLEIALELGAAEVAIFGSPSEFFSRKNTNCSLEENMKRFKSITELAKKRGLKIRGYISCVIACPYEGSMKPLDVAKLATSLFEIGCYEVSLGDTIGVGTPKKVLSLLNEMKDVADLSKFALHFHDTYGQAMANTCTGLDFGIRTFDSSVAGLGGCPYAVGATGNIATEDLLYFLSQQGVQTDVDLDKMVKVGEFISNELGKKNQSKVGNALLAKEKYKGVKVCI